MARPLRMEVPGGRFHISARGNERKIIFRDDRDRVHFLSLLGELTGRYGTLLHGYVLMDNAKAPEWLRLQPVRGLCGGHTEAQQVKALRQYTEDALKERELECPWEKLWAGMVLGTEQFARELLGKFKPNRREQPQAAHMEPSLSWERTPTPQTPP